MKTLFTLLAAGLFAFAAIAQSKPSSNKQTISREVKPLAAKYWCTNCDYSSVKEGVCPTHKTTLVKEGMYFCKGDEAKATDKMGECKNGTAMTSMDESYKKKMETPKPAEKK